MEDILKDLSFTCIEFSFYAREQVKMEYWFGAILRSRFLNKADEVTDEHGVSLRTIINTLPLPENHFMYKQWKGGFPKGFVFDCSDIPYDHPGFTLEANKIYEIRLFLIGNCKKYSDLYINATRCMLEEGFGHIPLNIIDMVRKGTFGFPKYNFKQEQDNLFVEFITPVNLVHIQNLSVNGYQGKLNNFPSFYQLMRSVAYRLLSLEILYTTHADGLTSHDDFETMVETYIQEAIYPTLVQANLRLEKRHSTPKGSSNQLSIFEGYIGHMAFRNVPTHYFPILDFASSLNIGNDINYGLGTFRVNFNIPY